MVPLELVERYGHTFIDFWLLRPRRFLVAVKKNKDKYISPMQFLVLTLGIGFAMTVAMISLSYSALESVTGEKPHGDPTALATLVIVASLVTMVFGTLATRFVCGVWPVRGGATFVPLFEFQCYLSALLLPVMAIYVILVPILRQLVASEIVPVWVGFIPAVLGLLASLIVGVVYQLPGTAYIAGVSTARLWLGVIFWTCMSGVIGGVIGFVIGFVSAYWF